MDGDARSLTGTTRSPVDLVSSLAIGTVILGLGLAFPKPPEFPPLFLWLARMLDLTLGPSGLLVVKDSAGWLNKLF